MIKQRYKEKREVEKVVLVKRINYLNANNGSSQTISHSGISLIIQQEQLKVNEAPTLSFYLHCWTKEKLNSLSNNTQILEFCLDSILHCKNQIGKKFQLQVTEGIQQLANLLFAYYHYFVQKGVTYPVEQGALTLVDLILTMNHDVFQADSGDDYAAVIQYMEKNMNKRLTVTDMHKELHLSRATLNRLSRKNADMSVMELCRALKLSKAERFLKETSFSIAEISKMLGFKDDSYFNKIFKKFYGITPLEFRKKAGGIYK